MQGQLSHELDVSVPASEVWAIYSTFDVARVSREALSHIVDKMEVIEGDGGVGTIIQLTLRSGPSGPMKYKERFTKIDHENRVKEAQVIEGGYLDLGFRLYKFRFQVMEKGVDVSTIRSTIVYEIEEEFAANASLVNITALALVAEAVGKCVTEKKAIAHKA